MATSFSGGGSRSTRRETPTLGKQLVNFITCGCESSAPFFVIYKAGYDTYLIEGPALLKETCIYQYMSSYTIKSLLKFSFVYNA